MKSLWAASLLVACETASPSDAPVAAPVDASTLDASEGGHDAASAAGFRAETPLPHPLQELTATVHGDRIVVAGGIDGSISVVNEVWALDGSTWTALPSLPAPRHHGMLVSLGEQLYYLGGMADLRFEPLDTVFVLQDGASAWEVSPPLPRPSAAAVAVALGAEIVIVGGQSDRGLEARPTAFDPVTGTARDGAPHPEPREHVAGALVEGELWLIGGRDFEPARSTARVDVYDPTADAWRSEALLTEVRSGHSATLLGTEIVVAGGEIGGAALATYERLVDGAWQSAPLPGPRHGHAAVAHGGRAYLIGGADRPLFGAIASVESWAP